jgi:hypothetical protein
MQAGADHLERDPLRRDSKLGTYRRATVALCEAAPRQGSTGQRRMRAAQLLAARKRSFGSLANASPPTPETPLPSWSSRWRR